MVVLLCISGSAIARLDLSGCGRISVLLSVVLVDMGLARRVMALSKID